MIDKKWTTEALPEMSGKIVIVTGGNSGLGFASVKAFAQNGAQVIIACRSMKRGEAARKGILTIQPSAKIKVMELDLSNLWSIRLFAREFNKKFTRLDILMNNAGIMNTPYQQTRDGIELQQSTNYFGHYALTGLLIEKLAATPGSRVVNVSSIAHRSGTLNFNNLLYEKGRHYTSMGAYSRSKLESLMFTFELQRFFEAQNMDCKAVVAHPGVSDTNLFNNSFQKVLMKLIRPAFSRFAQPAEMGALPQLRAAVDPSVKGGEFFGPDGALQIKGYPVKVKAAKHAYDKENAKKLWDYSEKITGVCFPEIVKEETKAVKKMVV